MCIHFTPENLSNYTRVSLDLRVIPGVMWIEGHDQFTKTPGYYAKCYKETTSHWKCDDLPEPDWRIGFPFKKS